MPATSIAIILLGIAIIGLNILTYQDRLPQTITNENNSLIQQQGYAFYVLLVGGKIIVLFGIRKLYLYYRNILPESNETTPSSSQTDSISSSLSPALSKKPSLFSIIVSIIGNNNALKVFLPVVAGYGLFYSIVSSMLIFRAEGFHHTTGLTAPYLTIMTHGPIGYAPSISLGITDHIGLLIIPINLIILCSVSSLVGLNAVLSIYAFLNRPGKDKTLFAANNSSNSAAYFKGSPLVTAMGASAGIFAVCPTCASLYIFGVLTGSFASTITTFGVAFYGLFAAISIPLLLFSPFVTALILRKTLGGSKLCYLKK